MRVIYREEQLSHRNGSGGHSSTSKKTPGNGGKFSVVSSAFLVELPQENKWEVANGLMEPLVPICKCDLQTPQWLAKALPKFPFNSAPFPFL